jgi:hypothetical protein
MIPGSTVHLWFCGLLFWVVFWGGLGVFCWLVLGVCCCSVVVCLGGLCVGCVLGEFLVKIFGGCVFCLVGWLTGVGYMGNQRRGFACWFVGRLSVSGNLPVGSVSLKVWV